MPTIPTALTYAPFQSKVVRHPNLGLVVGWMRRFAHKGKSDLTVRRLVERICANLEPGDYASEVLAIYYWVFRNIRYLRDIHDVEFVQEPAKVLEVGTGDCDDIATLLAAMCMAAGNRCSFALASFTNPPAPSHVYAQVHTPAGMVPLDPVANVETSRMMQRMRRKDVVPVSDLPAPDLGAAPRKTHVRRVVTYSVFDYGPREYRYYQAEARVPATGWFRKQNGPPATPESIAARLPPGAQLIGSGPQARGIIATTLAGVGSVDGDDDPSRSGIVLPWVGLVALVGGVFWLGRKSRGFLGG